MSATISRQVIGDLLMTRASELEPTGVTVYRNRPDNQPPLVKKVQLADPAGFVAPYVVVQPAVGSPYVNGERDVADQQVDLSAVHGITCVAGNPDACEALVDDVWPLFFRWRPVLPGIDFGLMRPPAGFEPGPARPDEKYTPPRFFVPLQFRLDVTT